MRIRKNELIKKLLKINKLLLFKKRKLKINKNIFKKRHLILFIKYSNINLFSKPYNKIKKYLIFNQIIKKCSEKSYNEYRDSKICTRKNKINSYFIKKTDNLFLGNIYYNIKKLADRAKLKKIKYYRDDYVEKDYGIFRYTFISKGSSLLFESIFFIHNFLLFNKIIDFLFKHNIKFSHITINYSFKFKNQSGTFETPSEDSYLHLEFKKINLETLISYFFPIIKQLIEKYKPTTFISFSITVIGIPINI